ncbi:MAG: Uncharacterized protein G01um101433_998 [Parcubacteria group bacterium Gr01-1014_33]|nr:MAG: Uncharacterized protein G01um101433_998 [Parcubacteria group bacterium Gr01-1014_33]
MKDLRTATIEFEDLGNMKNLVQTYETIAANTMLRIRSSVLQNRAFHRGLERIFEDLRRAYQKEVMDLMKKKRVKSREGESLSVIRKNGKTVFVLLAANTGLYGDIIAHVFSFFAAEYRREPVDTIVVGKTGKAFFDETFSGAPYTYFDFPDNGIDIETLKDITRRLTPYEKVIVFYGTFKNFLLQQATFSSVSGENLSSDGLLYKQMKYIFEPELEKILVFFETEIFSSLLEQVFHESRLAKLSSRMVLLESASVNIEKRTKKIFLERGELRHRMMNKKQLNAIAGILLLGRTV